MRTKKRNRIEKYQKTKKNDAKKKKKKKKRTVKQGWIANAEWFSLDVGLYFRGFSIRNS